MERFKNCFRRVLTLSPERQSDRSSTSEENMETFTNQTTHVGSSYRQDDAYWHEVNEEFIAAVSNSDVQRMAWLLNHGAVVDFKDYSGRTGVYLACEHGHRDALACMLRHWPPFDPNIKAENGMAPIHIATYKNRPDMVAMLLRGHYKGNHYRGLTPQGPRKECALNTTDEDMRTALHIAAENGYTDIVEILLTHNLGANVHVKDLEKATPLILAAGRGHFTIVLMLINSGSKVNGRNQEFRTALMEAVAGNHPEVVQLLLSRGARVNITDQHGNTALHDAITMRSDRCLDILLKGGADPNIQDSRGRIPLHNAIIQGYHTGSHTLIDVGTDLNKQDEDGFSAVYLAAWDPWDKDTKALLLHLARQGADLNLCDSQGVPPIIKCWCRKENVRILIQYGCNVNVIMNPHSFTLPELAAMEDNFELVHMLLTAGFDTKLIDFSDNVSRGRHKGTYESLQILCSSPLHLTELCRLKVRDAIKGNIIKGIKTLPMPPLLQSFLSFDH